MSDEEKPHWCDVADQEALKWEKPLFNKEINDIKQHLAT